MDWEFGEGRGPVIAKHLSLVSTSLTLKQSQSMKVSMMTLDRLYKKVISWAKKVFGYKVFRIQGDSYKANMWLEQVDRSCEESFKIGRCLSEDSLQEVPGNGVGGRGKHRGPPGVFFSLMMKIRKIIPYCEVCYMNQSSMQCVLHAMTW